MGYAAWQIETPGGAFRKIELPRPILKSNQVLVKIMASGVNPLDTKIRAGQAAHARLTLPPQNVSLSELL